MLAFYVLSRTRPPPSFPLLGRRLPRLGLQRQGLTRPFSIHSALRKPASETVSPGTNIDLDEAGKPTTRISALLSRYLPIALSDENPVPAHASTFKKLIALAKPDQGMIYKALGLLLVSSSISLAVPFTVGKMIDFFTSTNPQIPFGLSPGSASAVLLAVFTIGAAANGARASLMKMAGQRIVARLRERTYDSALRQEVDYVEKGEGDVVSRLSVDTSIVGESITQNLSDGLRSIVMAGAGMTMMFWISPQLTGLMLAVVPPVSLGAFYYGRYLKDISHKRQEAVGEMTKVASESLSALRTVQAFNALPQEEAKFSSRVRDVLKLARLEAIATGIFFGATGWSGNVTVLALLGYGGSLVSSGAITVGQLTSLLLYTAYVGGGLQMLTYVVLKLLSKNKQLN